MRLITILLVLLICNICFSQNYKQVEIDINSEAVVKMILLNGVDLDHAEVTTNNNIKVLLSKTDIEKLTSLGISFRILLDDWNSYYKNLPIPSLSEKENTFKISKDIYNVSGFGYGSMGGFYTYQEVAASLDSMYAHYPNIITQKFVVGTTVKGNKLWGVKISDNPNVSENEPRTGFDALIHAREPASMSTLMYFMWYILENYGVDPEVTYLVNNREIFCVPVYNPDGYEQNRITNPTGGGMWRKNRSLNSGSYGVDLNRNFPYMWGYDNIGSSPTPSSDSYRGPSASSEFETQAMINFIKDKNIRTYISMHAYQNAFLYPWGYKNGITPDSATYREYCVDMSAFNGFEYGTGQQILGYVSNGASRDWHYGEQTTKNKILGYTMEIGSSSDGFWPSQSRIFPIAQKSLRSVMYNAFVAGDYLKLKKVTYNRPATPGDTIAATLYYRNKGQVTSKEHMSIIASSLSSYITLIDSISSVDSILSGSEGISVLPIKMKISSFAPIGTVIKCYYEIIDSTGSMSRDSASFTVTVSTSLTQNQEMPEGYSLQLNYPNPFNPSTSINYSLPEKQLVKIVVYDLLGRETAVLVNDIKEKGNYTVQFKAEGLSSGTYYYRMISGSFQRTMKMNYLK